MMGRAAATEAPIRRSPVGRLRTWLDSTLQSPDTVRVSPPPTTGRYEFKYLIRQEQCESIADLLATHLELDKYGHGRPRDTYTVRSIYYDSPGFKCYHEKENGDECRRKYRVRTYNETDTNALFLECKHRRGATYAKRKIRLDDDAMAGIAERRGIDPSIADPTSVLGQLLVGMDRWDYSPVSLVVYDRVAYVWPGQEDAVRVTFDRNLRAALFPSLKRIRSEQDLVPLLYGWVILEVKFNDLVPRFMRQLIASHDLQRQACSKYALSISQLLDEHPTKKEGWNHVHVL